MEPDYNNAEIILEIYKKYSYKTPEIIDGDYSFVLWDERKHELFCCRSKNGNKTLYYYEDENIFVFSELFKGFVKLFGIDLRLNEQYIADFLTFKGIAHEIDPYHTIYQNIKQIPPAHCLLIKDGKTRFWRYWKPEKKDEIILKNDREYEEKFIELLKNSLQKRIQGQNKIGLLLSGGLDSGAVASICCEVLKQKKRNLTTFTSIPYSGYQNWLSSRFIGDESILVKEYRNSFKNIEQHFLPFEEHNSYLKIDDYIKMFEQPYKFVENSFWVIDIVEQASKQNVDLLLNGQRGNITISWGSIYPYLLYLIQHKQYKKCHREIKCYAKQKEIKQFSVFRNLLIHTLPVNIKDILHSYRNRTNYFLKYLPIDNSFISYAKQKKRFRKFGQNNDYFPIFDSLTQRLNLFKLNTFTHREAARAKISMKYGVLSTDPTEDIDLIEFCLNIPEDQFVRNGITRRLLKSAMREYLPEKILNSKVKGRQGADWIQRIKPYWPTIKEELLSIGDFQLEKKYLDRSIIQKNLDMLEDFDFIRGDNMHVKILFRTLVFSRFLRMVEKGTLFD